MLHNLVEAIIDLSRYPQRGDLLNPNAWATSLASFTNRFSVRASKLAATGARGCVRARPTGGILLQPGFLACL